MGRRICGPDMSCRPRISVSGSRRRRRIYGRRRRVWIHKRRWRGCVTGLIGAGTQAALLCRVNGGDDATIPGCTWAPYMGDGARRAHSKDYRTDSSCPARREAYRSSGDSRRWEHIPAHNAGLDSNSNQRRTKNFAGRPSLGRYAPGCRNFGISAGAALSHQCESLGHALRRMSVRRPRRVRQRALTTA